MNKPTGIGWAFLFSALVIGGVRILTVDNSHSDLIQAYTRILQNETVNDERIDEILEVFAGKITLRYLTANGIEPFFLFGGCAFLALGQFMDKKRCESSSEISTIRPTEP
ncbi:hypothetical protein P3T73_06885 [Kiritimatiellota bacterium B12222]|nr:hypothetical protein P3T73_06885 [Kiritimatiellota bacterium B12222]